ncbi:S8 family serine peptidase [Neopusillimonas aromaticivorans]|uniref:S8 family serine peptidase n=1 Tax=Neopusillimonas aromaticivorans TaxID=2979868 RepID=UPI0025959614|nr:S8 family serine peptidase [Neopusillimonas aromaticivorans]WJJ94197.1 S8 family serine peptidase [Neopusillimonas aromaticivorans]
MTSYRAPLDETETDDLLLAAYRLASQKLLGSGVDVWSNSWGPSLWPFSLQDYQQAYLDVSRSVAEQGREGLGVVTLFAAGNARTERFDTADNVTDAMPWSIAVAASDQKGGLTSYSTPGAALLITAPGSDPRTIVTTDRSGSDGYNTAPGEAGNYTNTDESYFNGTSSATPT